MPFGTQKIIKVIRQFSFRSIFLRYWKRFTLIIIIPMICLNLLIYVGYYNVLHAQMKDASLRIHSFAYDSCARMLDNMEQNYLRIVQDDTIERYLRSKVQPEQNYEASIIQNVLTQCVNQDRNLHSVYLFSFSNEYVMSSGEGDYVTKFKHRNWYEYYLSSGNANFAIPAKLTTSISQDEQEILSFCYGIYYRNQCCGLVVFNYTYEQLAKSVFSAEKNQFFLIGRNDVILYSSQRELSGDVFSKHYSYTIQEDETVLLSQQDYIAVSRPLEFLSLDLKLVSITDQNMMQEGPFSLFILLILSLIISVLIPLLISLYISFSSYRTITDILNSFGALEPTDEPAEATDEIKYITQQISKLLSRTEHFESELSQKVALLKNSQIAAMQLQFNQHFLFNTLNHISMLARADAGGRNPTSKAISLLANLLRISLDTKQYLIPISSEILYAEKYIAIEQMKFPFEVIWDIDESIYNYKIIKLILQPIIENALSHGLEPIGEEKRKLLTIRGRMSEKEIIFHVMDNGKGFEPELLQHFNREMENEITTESQHIGLSNVNTRIKLIFGSNYGVKIFSDPFSGTDIQITFPKVENTEEAMKHLGENS